MDRTFTIVDSEVDVTGGKYVGKSPYSVASKAARAIFKQVKKGKTEVRFTLKETTPDSAGKLFRYVGVKTALEKPLVVKRGDSEIEIYHMYHVKSCRM